MTDSRMGSGAAGGRVADALGAAVGAEFDALATGGAGGGAGVEIFAGGAGLGFSVFTGFGAARVGGRVAAFASGDFAESEDMVMETTWSFMTTAKP